MKTPEAITKRDILHGVKKISDKDLQNLAEHFVQKGWISDAIDFSSQAPQRLQELRQKAAQEGDTFLLLKASRLIEEAEIPTQLLHECAAQAEQAGKTRYAIMAYEKLGSEEKVQSLQESIQDDGDLVAIQEEEVFIPEHADEIES